jgi:hypothetical protein
MSVGKYFKCFHAPRRGATLRSLRIVRYLSEGQIKTGIKRSGDEMLNSEQKDERSVARDDHPCYYSWYTNEKNRINSYCHFIIE